MIKRFFRKKDKAYLHSILTCAFFSGLLVVFCDALTSVSFFSGGMVCLIVSKLQKDIFFGRSQAELGKADTMEIVFMRSVFSVIAKWLAMLFLSLLFIGCLLIEPFAYVAGFATLLVFYQVFMVVGGINGRK